MKKSAEVIAVENEAVAIAEWLAGWQGKKEIAAREILVNGWVVIISYASGKGIAHAMEKVGA
jgi:hypothetical protein